MIVSYLIFTQCAAWLFVGIFWLLVLIDRVTSCDCDILEGANACYKCSKRIKIRRGK